MHREHRIQIRVRYKETDGQGLVHHANYFTFFEMGRVEQLRAAGFDYRRLEEEGTILVLNKVHCHFLAPAYFDDLLELTTCIERITPARVEHSYVLRRDKIVLAKATSVLACINREGKVQRMPEWMYVDQEPS